MDSRDVFCASAPRAFISFRFWSMRRNKPSPVATFSVIFEISDIQLAGDRLAMKIGHCCQLIDVEAKVFQFVIHDDEQYLTISTS